MTADIGPPHEPYGVMLPCTPETFADFVSGLLGAPQTIERRIFEPFEIRREDVENTFHVVNQRITQQNQASLMQFTAKIYYDDNSSVLLASLQDLLHYNEVRPLVSVGIHLTWSYLVKFPDRPAPEKQQIDITFRARREEDLSSDEIVISHPRIALRTSSIHIRIAHTARSWGVDLESLLTNHLRSFACEEARLRKFCSRHSGKAAALVFALVLSALLACTFATSVRLDEINLAKAEIARRLAPSAKLDFIIQELAVRAGAGHGLLVGAMSAVSVVMAVVMAVVTAVVLDSPSPSFLLLTRPSEVHREKVMRKRKRKWLVFIISILLAIATGVVGNWLFALAIARYH
jgi:hypothetical protein